MLRTDPVFASASTLAIALTVVPLGPLEAEELPGYLRDRGAGVATSMLGTYVREGEMLVYPFFEWYADSDLEYKPSELGYGLDVDYRGRYRASEQLLYLAYGVAPALALELEAAWISATLHKAPNDPSAVPDKVKESGLGDVEAQVRWRFRQ